MPFSSSCEQSARPRIPSSHRFPPGFAGVPHKSQHLLQSLFLLYSPIGVDLNTLLNQFQTHRFHHKVLGSSVYDSVHFPLCETRLIFWNENEKLKIFMKGKRHSKFKLWLNLLLILSRYFPKPRGLISPNSLNRIPIIMLKKTCKATFLPCLGKTLLFQVCWPEWSSNVLRVCMVQCFSF